MTAAYTPQKQSLAFCFWLDADSDSEKVPEMTQRPD